MGCKPDIVEQEIDSNRGTLNISMNNPYKLLDDHAFWKHAVENSDITFPDRIYNPEWTIDDSDKIATMGSCFAQHIAKWLRENEFNVPFYETTGFKEKEKTFSANYGNVYTVRQALQLVQECAGDRTPSEVAWERGERFIDAIRPNSIDGGFETKDEVLAARKDHLCSVRKMVQDFDVLIFTLGLTEAWEIKTCGTITPTAPGVIGGTYDPVKYQFLNFTYNEVMEDLKGFCEVLHDMRNGRPFKLLLTVSPVPLTATASGQNALMASTYSKAVLRSVAGDFATQNDFVEYFPSFEIINNPAAHSDFFESNLRSVKTSAVKNVMNVFSSTALTSPRLKGGMHTDEFDPDCEDALLEEFANDSVTSEESAGVVCVGNSHLVGLRSAIDNELESRGRPASYAFPSGWGKVSWLDFEQNKYLTHFAVKEGYEHLIDGMTIQNCDILVLVGLGLGGDTIVRSHGPMTRTASPKVSMDTNVSTRLVNFYRHHISQTMEAVKQLDVMAPYEKIFWIAAADMCVDVAKHRLGARFVDSGAYLIHKEAYRMAVNEHLNGFRKVQAIFHDDTMCDPTNGFTLSKYRMSDSPIDIHCNASYYLPAVKKVLGE